MRFAAKAVGAGIVGLGLGLAHTPLQAQSAGAPQNTVPDAPRPQTLPQLNTITPAAPATPNAPAAQPDTAAAVPSSLPSAPAPETPVAPQAASSGPAPAAHASDIRVLVNFVQVPFTVKDSRGQLVPGLTSRDVRVFEDGVQQTVRLFTVDPYPLSVAIVIDQSVTQDTMQKINTSLEALQGAFTPYDEVAVFTYNNGVQEQTGFTGAQSTRVTYALDRSKSQGREPVMGLTGPLAQTTVKNNQAVDPNTNGVNNTTLQQNLSPAREYHTLNDAILTAAQTVAKAGRGRRRVIYVISDGKEYGSQAKEKEVIRFLEENQIAVYATLVGDSSIPGVGFLDKFHLPLQMRDDVLPRYTDATGGQCDPEFRPRSIENSFAKLAEQVRIQYTVGYYSHEPFIDGKYRSTEVRVLRPNLDVIAKKGYYPSASDAVQGSPLRTSDTPGTPAAGSTGTAASGTPPTP